jgi:hypothetical protein
VIVGAPVGPGLSGLFGEILAGGNDLTVRVTGRSMAPCLRDGDVVTLQPVAASKVRPGDLVLFQPDAGAPMLHRVIRRSRSRDGRLLFRTMGDALCTLDHPFSEDALLGVAVALRREMAGGGERIVPLDAPLVRLRGRVTALLARWGFRRLRRARSIPPG